MKMNVLSVYVVFFLFVDEACDNDFLYMDI